jgi:general secretion pathway protein C
MALPRPYRLAIELGLLALVVCLAALGVSAALDGALYVPPAAPPAPTHIAGTAVLAPLDAYATIATRDVFNPAATGSPTASRGSGLRLWGVGLFGGSARAVIEDVNAHRQDLYRVGDEVAGARVGAIDWDRVTLERHGAEETLELTPGGDGPASDRTPDVPLPPGSETETIRRVAADAFVVDRRELAGTVDNMSGLLTQLRAVAEVEDGRAVGFRLFQIRDGSIFRRLGLENGDVVERVNGTTIGDPAALLGFLQRLRSEPRVALDIVRGGTARTLVYDLR